MKFHDVPCRMVIRDSEVVIVSIDIEVGDSSHEIHEYLSTALETIYNVLDETYNGYSFFYPTMLGNSIGEEKFNLEFKCFATKQDLPTLIQEYERSKS